MESSEAASRRVRCIASHLAAATAQNSFSSSLATMVCSSSPGSQLSRRKDGRLLYARQNRHVPAYLKDDKDTEVSDADSAPQALIRKDSRLMFARQGYHTRSFFMREHVETQVMPQMEGEDTCSQHLLDNHNKPSADFHHRPDERYDTDGEPPLFARPSFKGVNEGWRVKEHAFKEAQATDVKSKLDWHPRMDIAEANGTYVVTVELPGVNADGIRVEVNNDRLLVSGSRSMDLWVDKSKHSEEAVYHRRDLSRGPFRAHWPLPKNSNIDSISAEFMDGFLRILVPKNTL